VPLAALVLAASGCTRPSRGGTVADFDRDQAACAGQPDPRRCLMERGGIRAPVELLQPPSRGAARAPKDDD
jgi:hypothetical protein